MAAVRVPVAVGLKLMVIVHAALGANVAGEIGQFTLVTTKSEGFVPAAPMLVIDSAWLPVLERLTL
jgi:hypothetical protein